MAQGTTPFPGWQWTQRRWRQTHTAGPDLSMPSARGLAVTQQVDRGGSRSVVYTPHHRPADGRELALVRCCYHTRVHEPCTCANCWTSAGCWLFPISRESSRFHSWEFRNQKVRESRAPGKRVPGNENPNSTRGHADHIRPRQKT